MTNYSQETLKALNLLREHAVTFRKRFSHGKLPKEQDWKPIRFAVRDVLLGAVVLRHDEKNNIVLVDVCVSEDPYEIEDYSGTRVVTIFILSEAYKYGSSMGIRFTTNFGKQPSVVPGQIFDLAYNCGVELKKASEGVITPKEARHLYLALTEFSPQARERVMELSLADKVSPERVCYMVHHLTYTKEEMETILLGSEFPEHILLGKVTPEEYFLYQDVVLRTRDAVLGGMLDRTLKLKEVVGENGGVVDLEENDRRISIGFDSRFFVKVYETEEETPIPWTVNRNLVIQAGEHLVVMVRARDWADFEYYFAQDLAALQTMKEAYTDKFNHFFLLVPRNVLELEESVLENHRTQLAEIGVTLMVCPESVALLDRDVMGRLRECETMRHDIGSGEKRKTVVAAEIRFDFNTTEIRLVAIPRELKIGRLTLSQLTEQAVYDEDELSRGVNKHNVRARYHLVCDRLQFLAHQALSAGGYQSVTIDPTVFPILAELWNNMQGKVRNMRLLPIFWMPEHMKAYVGNARTLTEQIKAFQQIAKFLHSAYSKDQVVIAVQNKHARQTLGQPNVQVALEQLTQAFTGQFVPDWINDYGNLPFDDIVIKHIWRAVQSARRGQANGVNLSEVPHMIITKALHSMVYENPKKVDNQDVAINIVYTDGSQARPFPLFYLKLRDSEEMKALCEQKPMRIGMISMRHPEMDSLIHQYWFRNIEVSQPGMTSAEVDELCYQITLRKLADIYRLNKPVRIAFYQTGFQAPLVGFWRAVVEFLKEGQGKPPMLEIIPYFYQKRLQNEGQYEHGEPWH